MSPRTAARFALALAAVALAGCASPSAPVGTFGLAPVEAARSVQSNIPQPPAPLGTELPWCLSEVNRLAASHILNKRQAADLTGHLQAALDDYRTLDYFAATDELQATDDLLVGYHKLGKKGPQGLDSLQSHVEGVLAPMRAWAYGT